MDEHGLQGNPQNLQAGLLSYNELFFQNTNALKNIAQDNLRSAIQTDYKDQLDFLNKIILPITAVMVCNELVKVATLTGILMDSFLLEARRDVLDRMGKTDELDSALSEEIQRYERLVKLVDGYGQTFEADKWEMHCKAHPDKHNFEALDILKRAHGSILYLKDNFLLGIEHPAVVRIRANIGRLMPVYEVPYLIFPQNSLLNLAVRVIIQGAIRRAIQGGFLPIQDVDAYCSLPEEEQLKYKINVDAFSPAARDGWVFYRALEAAEQWALSIQRRQQHRMGHQGLLPAIASDKPQSVILPALPTKAATRHDLQIKFLLDIKKTMMESMPDATRKQVHEECQRQRPDLFTIGFEAFRKVWKATNKVG